MEERFSFNQGDLWALLTAVSVAGALVFGEKSLKATDAITISAIQTFITAVISIAGALLFDDISTITKISTRSLGCCYLSGYYMYLPGLFSAKRCLEILIFLLSINAAMYSTYFNCCGLILFT